MTLDLEKLRNRYGLDKAVTEGVEIALDGEPEYKFLVKVPSKYNRAFFAAANPAMKMEVDEHGAVRIADNDINPLEQRRRAFFDTCVVSCNAEKLPDSFYDEFLPAVDELWEKANKIAKAVDGQVDTAVKK